MNVSAKWKEKADCIITQAYSILRKKCVQSKAMGISFFFSILSTKYFPYTLDFVDKEMRIIDSWK